MLRRTKNRHIEANNETRITRRRHVNYHKREAEEWNTSSESGGCRTRRIWQRRDYEKQEFTVNSSPYSAEIYKHLGFVQEDAERLSPEGLRYTPMRFTERH